MERTQQLLFEAFTQERDHVTSEVTGTGLGLAIVKKFVELMDGTIKVKSKLGEGTSFVVCIDARPTADSAYKEASSLNYYDVVLMDIRMPVMNGIEATKAIRELERVDAKTVPIIAMTANAYDVDVKASLDAGMNAHLAKPIDPNKLYATLDKHFQLTE